jgi:phosphoribosylformimino-5-aminoimidazole carboxamide ribotide isomerase
MIIIPAIDLKGGKCVRLRQGKMDTSTVFNEDPAEQARTWETFGAARIHVVDLDGSIRGKPANLGSIRQIVERVGIPVQVGGGIRDERTIREYLDIGVAQVILGTVAAKEPDLVNGLITRFPGKVAVGIDARAGKVAVEGWTESTDIQASELARYFEAAGAASFIYTDIERDGMMAGPNIEATRDFAQNTSIPVILSGGVSELGDIERALPLEKDGVVGVIVGRALYEGAIDLADAIALTEKAHARQKNNPLS